MSGLDAIGYGEPVPAWVRTRIGLPLMRVEFGASDPLDEPGGYRYEIPAGDRRILEQAIADAKSTQGDQFRQGLARGAILGALNSMPIYGPFLKLGGEKIMNWLGFGVRVELSSAAGAIVVTYTSNGWGDPWSKSIVTQAVKVASVPESPASGGCYVSLRFEAAFTVDQWSIQPGSPSRYLANTPSLGLALFSDEGAELSGLSTRSHQVVADVYAGEPAPGYEPAWSGETNTVFLSNFAYARPFMSDNSPDNRRYFGPETGIKCGSPFDLEGPSGDLGDIAGIGDLPPGASDLTPEEMRNLIGNLKETPWYDKYPPTEQPVLEPSPTPHPSDPGWPCSPKLPGDPVGRIVTGPGNIRVPRPPGFDGPSPGEEFCVVIAGKKRCGKIRRVPPPGGDMIIEEPPYRDEMFTKPYCPKKGTLLVDIAKKLAEELGLKPGAGGSWVIDGACKKRWPGGCFPKGSSKFDAMWKVADMCGYGIIADPDNPFIGPIKPLPPDPRTFGPYHEHRDLFVFEAVQDDLDIPSHVEVSRPHYRGSPGYSVVIEVKTPYALKDKWLTITVPRGTKEADAMDLAAKKARDFEVITKLTDYAIPYNEYVAARHQQRLRIPSEGYDATFMVYTFEHEIDMDQGAVTKVRGVELNRVRYAPRFEGYDQVWANAPAGYGVMS